MGSKSGYPSSSLSNIIFTVNLNKNYDNRFKIRRHFRRNETNS